MSLQGHRTTTINASDSNDLFFNPFANASQSSFSSAVKKTTMAEGGGSIGTRLAFRRRGSESSVARKSGNDQDAWQSDSDGSGSGVHARSKTADAVVGSSSSTRFHPLQPPSHRTLGASSSRSSVTDTRPRLKRLLSDLGPETNDKNDSEDEGEAGPRRSPALKEKVVIIHEVTPTDSLAGVALKYGTSMADLRKANMLWTSDPIHLRKILYIPLDKSSKAKELVLSQLESTSTDALSSQDNLVRSSANTATDDATALSSSSSLTIRRVPVSQLSFFPPPSSSVHPSSTVASSRTMPRSGQTSRTRNPIPFETAPSASSAYPVASSYSLPGTSAFASALQAPPSPTPPRAPIPSLTSLFSALPIGRISFDSNASTPSQASEDQEHELDDVSRASPPREGWQKARPRQQDYLNSHSARSPLKSPSRQIDTVELSPFPSLDYSGRTNGIKGSETRRSQRAMHYTSPDLNSLSSEVVQTSQPKPSPAMQLPLMSRRDP